MKSLFSEIKPEQIDKNPFMAIGQEWMLITAGSAEKFNTMTASWGAWGILWHRPVVFCFVRPTRYTYEFMETSDKFTLSFFDGIHKDALNLCGTKSGRAVNKVKEAGLVAWPKDGWVAFEQARLIVACQKIYFQQIDPKHFLDASVDENYPQNDYHRMYVGQVQRVWQRV